MDCVGCSSGAVTERPDLTAQGYHRFRCRDCGKQFNERSGGVLPSRVDSCQVNRYDQFGVLDRPLDVVQSGPRVLAAWRGQ